MAASLTPGGGLPNPLPPPASTGPPQYSLRWNNHQDNLLSVFGDLLRTEAFVDVTLHCEGNRELKAHKMVLSACSPYFQSMLYNTPDRHPIVFLRDIRHYEMKALLEFMYKGEVSVDQENLNSLLKVAEGLKIKGLAADVEDKPSTRTSTSSNPTPLPIHFPNGEPPRPSFAPPPPPPSHNLSVLASQATAAPQALLHHPALSQASTLEALASLKRLGSPIHHHTPLAINSQPSPAALPPPSPVAPSQIQVSAPLPSVALQPPVVSIPSPSELAAQIGLAQAAAAAQQQAAVQAAVAAQAAQQQAAQAALGPKRKRARPRRLSGADAVPMALERENGGLDRLGRPLVIDDDNNTTAGSGATAAETKTENETAGVGATATDLKPEDEEMPEVGGRKQGSSKSEGEVADSHDGRSSGLLSPKKEWVLAAAAEAERQQLQNQRQTTTFTTTLPPNTIQQQITTSPQMGITGVIGLQRVQLAPPPSVGPSIFTSGSPLVTAVNLSTTPSSSTTAASPLPSSSAVTAISLALTSNASSTVTSPNAVGSPNSSLPSPKTSPTKERSASSGPGSSPASGSGTSQRRGNKHPRSRFAVRRRIPTSHDNDEDVGTKQFSEMSVRGLDLLRYATLDSDGTYRCIECERLKISKNFKNKYSFQRHAFLYHEGVERKVFPCPICQKEFSRPDKMKSHLKAAHDCVLPASTSSKTDIAEGGQSSPSPNHATNSKASKANSNNIDAGVAATASSSTSPGGGKGKKSTNANATVTSALTNSQPPPPAHTSPTIITTAPMTLPPPPPVGVPLTVSTSGTPTSTTTLLAAAAGPQYLFPFLKLAAVQQQQAAVNIMAAPSPISDAAGPSLSSGISPSSLRSRSRSPVGSPSSIDLSMSPAGGRGVGAASGGGAASASTSAAGVRGRRLK